MSRDLPLPQLSKEKVVIFHLNQMEDRHLVVLQIPRGKDRSLTYSLRLDSERDFLYIKNLKNGMKVIDLLRLDSHVAFFPATGECRKLTEGDDGRSVIARFNASVLSDIGRHREGRGSGHYPWEIPTL
jgi:hypothetical protein